MNCNFHKDSNKIFFYKKREAKIDERRETRNEKREMGDGSLGKPLTTSNAPNTP